MTNDQIRRTKQALNETHELLARELGYPTYLQEAERIAFYRRHITKLKRMLEL